MNLKLIKAATSENVSLNEAKVHLRVTDSDSDSQISMLIKAARQDCENFTGRALASQDFELALDSFPSDKITLPVPPVEKILSIKYKDSDGIEYTLNTADYIFYNSVPAVVLPDYGTAFPVFSAYPAGAVRVSFTAGYKSASTDASLVMPEAIKQAILLLVGHYYDNREIVNVGNNVTELPYGIKALLMPYKVWSF